MGIPGLWKIVQPAEQTETYAGIVSKHLASREGKPGIDGYIIGVDASLWTNAAAQATARKMVLTGPSPALRTIFYRLARLAALPLSLVFVFDGPQRPAIKRAKKVHSAEHLLTQHLRILVRAFGFHEITAPGEAEAELAAMNRAGTIDAVLTDDSDALVFGARTIIRNPNVKSEKEQIRIYTSSSIEGHPKVLLNSEEMVLVAVLTGGDYSKGLSGCGSHLARGLARYGLGRQLIQACSHGTSPTRQTALAAWRESLRRCLRDDPRGYLQRRYGALARNIPDTFPDATVVRLYTHPRISTPPPTRTNLYSLRSRPLRIDLPGLARLCERHFGWGPELVLEKFKAFVWPAVALREIINDINRGPRLIGGPGNTSTPKSDASESTSTKIYTVLQSATRRDRNRDEYQVTIDTRDLKSAVQSALVYATDEERSAAVLESRQSHDGNVTVRVPGAVIRMLPSDQTVSDMSPGAASTSTSSPGPSTSAATSMCPSLPARAPVPNVPPMSTRHDTQSLPASNPDVIDLSLESPLMLPRATRGVVIDLTLQ